MTNKWLMDTSSLFLAIKLDTEFRLANTSNDYERNISQYNM